MALLNPSQEIFAVLRVSQKQSYHFHCTLSSVETHVINFIDRSHNSIDKQEKTRISCEDEINEDKKTNFKIFTDFWNLVHKKKLDAFSLYH